MSLYATELVATVGTGTLSFQAQLRNPVHSAMACNIERQFQTAPDAKLVKGGPKIVLHDLFAGSPQPCQCRGL